MNNSSCCFWQISWNKSKTKQYHSFIRTKAKTLKKSCASLAISASVRTKGVVVVDVAAAVVVADDDDDDVVDFLVVVDDEFVAVVVVVDGGGELFLDGEVNNLFLSSPEEESDEEEESGKASSVDVEEEIDRCRGAMFLLLLMLSS
jgi:hypothetical protein